MGGTEAVALRTWLGFLAMCLGMFMAILDIQIVASSLPEIQAALHIPVHWLSWVQTAYLIAEIIAIPLTGCLTRMLSLGGLFIAATAGFTLASTGCAQSGGFAALVAWRVVQGFCGGLIIPAVFTSVFELFPRAAQIRATTIAGIFAMLAPTLGPAFGGFITETYSWHWLFLINVGPGIVACAVAAVALRTGGGDWSLLRRFDYPSLALLTLCLASLEIALKEGPPRGWSDPLVLVLCLLCVVTTGLLIRRSISRDAPLVRLTLFSDRGFCVSCLYSFVLGAGLYGSVYLLSIFLGFVRNHTPLEIGTIMLVSGGAQLIAAPVAANLERRFNRRWLTFIGYGLFGGGLLLNANATYETDFAGLFWPQLLRGAGVMFCLLPTTSLALETQPQDRVADASGLFNLMRNLGGAIGIALIDTILEMRVPAHVAQLVERLQAGDPVAALAVGLPVERFHNLPMANVDDATKELIRPLIERAALVASFNDAYLMLGVAFVLALLLLPLLRPAPAHVPRIHFVEGI